MSEITEPSSTRIIKHEIPCVITDASKFTVCHCNKSTNYCSSTANSMPKIRIETESEANKEKKKIVFSDFSSYL